MSFDQVPLRDQYGNEMPQPSSKYCMICNEDSIKKGNGENKLYFNSYSELAQHITVCHNTNYQRDPKEFMRCK